MKRCSAGWGAASRRSGFLPEDAIAKALMALQALPPALRHHGNPRRPPDRDRRGARRRERAAISRTCGARDRLPDPAARRAPREARLAALGVVSSIHEPDGVVGDLGGGSLELTDIRAGTDRAGHHAAARRPSADRTFRALAKEGRENRARRARRGRRRWSNCRGARSMPSAARGARWRGFTCASASIRCT